MTPQEQATLWLGALRYYLGRQTYAVSDFCQLLIREWESLDDRTQSLVHRDLAEEFVRDDAARKRGDRYLPMGMDMDRDSWEKLRMHTGLLRLAPKPGERYRHFKGDVCTILCVTTDRPFNPQYDAPRYWTRHAETTETIGVWCNDDDTCWASIDGVDSIPHLVVYQNEEYNCWAQPLNNFLAVLCDGKPIEPGVSNDRSKFHYRFSLLLPDRPIPVGQD